jgi:hypothetical protein
MLFLLSFIYFLPHLFFLKQENTFALGSRWRLPLEIKALSVCYVIFLVLREFAEFPIRCCLQCLFPGWMYSNMKGNKTNILFIPAAASFFSYFANI